MVRTVTMKIVVAIFCRWPFLREEMISIFLDSTILTFITALEMWRFFKINWSTYKVVGSWKQVCGYHGDHWRVMREQKMDNDREIK